MLKICAFFVSTAVAEIVGAICRSVELGAVRLAADFASDRGWPFPRGLRWNLRSLGHGMALAGRRSEADVLGPRAAAVAIASMAIIV